MLDELSRLITECWRSRLGRAFFLIHLLVCMTLVGYFWSNLSSPDIPGIRKLYFVLNWFSIFQLESLFVVFRRPSASRFTDGISTFLFSIPWWLYGYGAEIGAKKLRELLLPSVNRVAKPTRYRRWYGHDALRPPWKRRGVKKTTNTHEIHEPRQDTKPETSIQIRKIRLICPIRVQKSVVV